MMAQIREAAIAEFSLHGFKGVSTQMIAQRAGITKQQLHYYIKGKEHLYEELLFGLLQRWTDAFTFDHQTDDPRHTLAHYIRTKLDYALDQPELSRLFTNEVLSGGTNLEKYWPMAVRDTHKAVAAIQHWMDLGLMRRMDPQLLLMHIWAMTQHYADYGVQARVMLGLEADAALPREQIAHELVNLVLLGCGLPAL